MGYSCQWREKVLHSCMVGYLWILKEKKERTSRRNRRGTDTSVKMRLMKLCGNHSSYYLAKDESKLQD